ncbi:hypothetical protein [uncultured Flavobacterium sp.]
MNNALRESILIQYFGDWISKYFILVTIERASINKVIVTIITVGF